MWPADRHALAICAVCRRRKGYGVRPTLGALCFTSNDCRGEAKCSTFWARLVCCTCEDVAFGWVPARPYCSDVVVDACCIAQTVKRFNEMLDGIQALDANDVFREPVSPSIAYNYFSFVSDCTLPGGYVRPSIQVFASASLSHAALILLAQVRRPMDFSTLRKILHQAPAAASGAPARTNEQAHFSSLQDAYEDLQRIFLNCMHYNKEVRAQEGSLAQLAKVLLEHARSLAKEAFAINV